MSSNPEHPPGLPLPLTGRTSIFAILGDPVAQAGSPILFNTAFRQRGWEAVLVPMHVTAKDLPDVLRGLRGIRNLKGIVLTTPHKEAALPFVDSIGPEAQLVRSINAIRRTEAGLWQAENFDGLGCVRGMLSAGHKLAGRRVLLIGTGGAGRAVAAAVARQKPASLTLHDIDSGRLARTVADLGKAFPGLVSGAQDPDPGNFDAVINCTPLGMAAYPGIPLDTERLKPGTLVTELVIEPVMTTLLSAAKQKGCEVQPGRRTLEGQVDAICSFFAGENHE